jgi:hypothetical protein
VSVLQAVPHRPLLRSRMPVVRLPLEGGELRGKVRQLAGEVLGSVPMISWSTHAIRIRTIGEVHVVSPLPQSKRARTSLEERGPAEGIMRGWRADKPPRRSGLPSGKTKRWTCYKKKNLAPGIITPS